MKKLIALILASICLVTLASCSPVVPGYATTVAYAGWSDDPAIADGSINKGQLTNGNGEHLPIFRFDTLEDLNQFKATYENVLAFDQGYNSTLSFNAALKKAQWDRDGFFANHSLLAVYVPANSGSYRFAVQGVGILKSSLCVYIEQINRPGAVSDDMAGWFVFVEIADEEIRHCNTFDAILVNP